MCSNGRCGSLVGLAHSAAKLGTGLTGESTKSKGWQAATAASRIAPIWLKPWKTCAPSSPAALSTQSRM